MIAAFLWARLQDELTLLPIDWHTGIATAPSSKQRKTDIS